MLTERLNTASSLASRALLLLLVPGNEQAYMLT